MIHLANILLLSVFVGSSYAAYCQDNFTLGELPQGVLQGAIDILLTGQVKDFLGCPGHVSIPDGSIKLQLYTRGNLDNPVILDPSNPSQLDENKLIILLVHGWLCSQSDSKMPELRAAYLERYDANVIGIDWSELSIAPYSDAYCNIPKIAEHIAMFLCKISADKGVDLSTVHLIGHSLGGQISGYTGQEVAAQCGKKIGRITGLDPAGPLYQMEPTHKRLDASDASAVDVIHTNMAILGYYGSCGSADFYPNCGTSQPGCLSINNATNIKSILNTAFTRVYCNHMRSLDYMIESISSGGFEATSCRECPGLPLVGPCTADILLPKYAPMGENCPANPAAPKFYLKTNSKSPYSEQ